METADGSPRTFTVNGEIHQHMLDHARDDVRAFYAQFLVPAVEQEFERRAATDARVARLRTHPGVDRLIALVVVHTLELVTRFDRSPRSVC